MERLLTSAKQLCEDARVAEETATKDGDLYRQSLKNPSEQWKFTNKFTNVTAQRRSVNEIRQMVTFSTERDVPVCKVNSTHFERFAAFAKLELQQALEVIKEAHQQFTETLDFFCEDTNTQVGDFFGIIDQFMIAFDKTQEQVEREEEDKLKAARRTLAKEARLKVKPAFKNEVDASKISDEKPSTLLLPSMNSTTRFDIGAAESNDGDSRHALFAAIKSHLVENIQQDEEVAVIAESESHQWQKEEVLEEARPKKEAKEQDAALRVKIEAEEELNRQKAELRARIDAIERARREEEERNESARKAEEDCKSEELERRKSEQEELRIREDRLFRREHTDPRNSTEHRDEAKAKEAEEVHSEWEARKQMKKALQDKIMAKEKAEREKMELRASFTEELREQQEDNVEDSLRAWIAKKEKKSPSKIASSSNGSTGRCRPEFSRQPSRLSMAVAQAAAAKQRRESAVVTSTTS
eukprot:scaffold4390_cov71-Skeletonema_dohrnii-CCMP3373.AAC.14